MVFYTVELWQVILQNKSSSKFKEKLDKMEEENHWQLLSTQIHTAENDWKVGEQYLRKRAYIFALLL